MIDWDAPLRKAYFNALDGQVQIESSVIPVVDSKAEHQQTEHDIYIKLSVQNVQKTNTKDRYIALASIQVDIVQWAPDTASRWDLDDAGNQIMGILFPTRKTLGFTIDSPLSVPVAWLESTNTSLPIAVNDGFMIVKSLIFNNRIVQP